MDRQAKIEPHSTRSRLAGWRAGWLQEILEGIKASVRAKTEHPFRTIKQQFGNHKLRYPLPLAGKKAVCMCGGIQSAKSREYPAFTG